MDLETRFKNEVLVLQQSNYVELTSKEVAKRYLPMPTTSDSLTTGTILNMMYLLGYVQKNRIQKSGKTYYIKYSANTKINKVKV